MLTRKQMWRRVKPITTSPNNDTRSQGDVTSTSIPTSTSEKSFNSYLSCNHIDINMELEKNKSDKCVKFSLCNQIQVISMPEMFFNDQLYWNDNDMAQFKKDTETEIKGFLTTFEGQMNIYAAIQLLYQPVSELSGKCPSIINCHYNKIYLPVSSFDCESEEACIETMSERSFAETDIESLLSSNSNNNSNTSDSFFEEDIYLGDM